MKGKQLRRKTQQIRYWLASMLLLISTALPAFAMTLDQAKVQGYIGERSDGYLGYVNAQTPEQVKSLVEKVNQERRTHYTNIAQTNNIPIARVERIAGEKLINRTPPGQYIRTVNGQWIKK